MRTAKLFQNGQSQAVRLPKDFRFEGKEVIIRRYGKGVMLLPVEKTWDTLFNSLNLFSDDFMDSRQQPAQQHREKLFE